MKREIGFSLRLSEDEMDQVRQLALLHDRSMNSYIRSLIRQSWNKTTLTIPTKKAKKQEAEITQ